MILGRGFSPFIFVLQPIPADTLFSAFLSSALRRRGGCGRGRPVFQADVQRGFPVQPILWGEPACQHHHGKGPLRGGDASAGFPDQAAHGSDPPVTTWTLLCAQSAQLHQLWDQEQRWARSEELHFSCRGNNWSYSFIYFIDPSLVMLRCWVPTI